MPSELPNNNPLSYLGVKPETPPNFIRANRVPQNTDTKYDLGTIWLDTVTKNLFALVDVAAGVATWDPYAGATTGVDFMTGDSGGPVLPAGGNINIVGSDLTTVTGAGNTLTITETSGAYPISPYVVGVAGEAGYTTIQDALDAANAAGGGSVFVQEGTYNENLICYDNTQVVGAVGLGDSGAIIINGTHTPPLTGAFVFRNVRLESATDIFNSAAAGSSTLRIIDALVAITNGYIWNLPNWTGHFSCFDLGDASTTNGVVNNPTGGALITFFEVSVGAGTGLTAIMSGNVIGTAINWGCPTEFVTGANVSIDRCSWNNAPVTFSNNSVGTLGFPRIDGIGQPAIVMNTSGDVNVYLGTLNTNNSPAISGTGVGTLTLSGIVWLQNSGIAGTVTTSFVPLEGGTGYFQNLTFDRGTTEVDTDGQLIIGSTGNNPQIATLTAGAGIAVTNGAGSITISSTAGGFAWNEVTGTSANMSVSNGYIANNAGLVTLTLPATAVIGDTIQIVGKGAGGWRIAQNAGQTIYFGVATSTTGAGGYIESTNDRDTVELICVTANNDWNVIDAIGTINVN